MATQQCKLLASLGLLLLRLGVGGYLFTHGLGKLNMVIEGQFEMFADPIGIGKAPSLVLVTFAEFVCALLVMVGLATRLAAVPVVIAMGVAAFVAHGNDPWTTEEAVRLFLAKETQFPVSKEPALLFLIPFLALIFTGPGCLSLDALIRRWWRGPESQATVAA